jgi:hypothetical protein
MQPQNSTSQFHSQIPPSQKEKLSDLREANFFLASYRTKIDGRKKSDTVDTLMQAILHLQVAEGMAAGR